MAELRQHVIEEIGDADGVLIVNGCAFPKKGNASCGVTRRWCGRLGVFLNYATEFAYAPLDRPLYLPKDWAEDAERREQCHVPQTLVFQERWRIGLDLLARSNDVLHRWVTADDEFGRVTAFRRELRFRREH